jgi:preprotein translocase subunit SecA
MFEQLMASIKTKVVSSEFRSATATRMQQMFSRLERRRIVTNEDSVSVDGDGGAQPSAAAREPLTVADVFASMMSHSAASAPVAQPQSAAARPDSQVGRNDPCPCGSGKKYKKCCGRNMI